MGTDQTSAEGRAGLPAKTTKTKVSAAKAKPVQAEAAVEKSASASTKKKPAAKVAELATATKKASAKPASPKQKTAATPSGTPAKAKSPVKKKSTPTPALSENSEESVVIRAYHVWEKRMQLGLPGDEASDWIEAERQLREEARRKNSATV